MHAISLQERFRQTEAICSTLPMGYGWNISLDCNGASVPVFKVYIETGYDSYLNSPTMQDFVIDTNSKEEEFERFISDLDKAVTRICDKQKKIDEEKKTSNNPEEEWLPF